MRNIPVRMQSIYSWRGDPKKAFLLARCGARSEARLTKTRALKHLARVKPMR